MKSYFIIESEIISARLLQFLTANNFKKNQKSFAKLK
jgi:hypothetical protein